MTRNRKLLLTPFQLWDSNICKYLSGMLFDVWCALRLEAFNNLEYCIGFLAYDEEYIALGQLSILSWVEQASLFASKEYSTPNSHLKTT